MFERSPVASSNAASPLIFFVIIISNLLLETCEERLELQEQEIIRIKIINLNELHFIDYNNNE